MCTRANSNYAAARAKQNPDTKRRRDRAWRRRNKERINDRRRKSKWVARSVAAAEVKRRLRAQGVTLDYIVDKPHTDYLVYALIDPRTIAVRYVGVSSSGLGRPKAHGVPSALALGENKRKDDWIKSLQTLGLSYAIRVLEYFDDPHSAHGAEPWWIQWMRDHGEHLYNITAGNDSQIVVSAETREKMRVAMTGRTITWGDKISKAKKGQGPVAKLYGGQTLKAWAAHNGVTETVIRYRLKHGWPLDQAVVPHGVSPRAVETHTFNGESLSLEQWATRVGINVSTLRTRIRQQGWSIEKALTTPVKLRRT